MPLFRSRAAGLSGVLGTLAGLICAALSTAGPAYAAAPTLLYASPSGSGSTCSLSAPCSLDGAKSKVAGLAPAMAADIDVYLRGGTYRLSQAFALGPSDSGRNGFKVVYAAYPGEKPVLNGATKLSGFTVFDSSKNIYRASVPTGTQSRQLFVDGVRAQRARGPLNPSGFTLSGSSFTTSDSSYASFTNASSVEIVNNNAWKQMRCPLASITAPGGGGSSLNVDPTCFANNNTSVPNRGFPFNGAGLPKLTSISYLENAYQLLDSPGEFYLDSSAGFLYYKPRSGEDLSTADVELPTTETLLNVSGTPGHLAPVNDTDPAITYTGSWSSSSGRGLGDLYNDVHATTANGDSVSYTFTGTGIDVLSETNSDEGGIDVYVDGAKVQSVSAAGSSRLAQQVVASVSGLAKGQHTIKLVKTGGTYMILDGFTVVPDVITPVHDITFQNLTFAYTTWTLPSTAGYIDNQAGVLWDTANNNAPFRIPAAVQVHRGSDITFTGDEITHTGGTGIDLADGSKNSTITGSYIHDTSGGGVSVGEVDDYYLTDTSRMTTGDTVSQNWISDVGQDYSDAVGIWAGYTRGLTLSHNDIGHTPYSGMSLGWGWGYASPCSMQSAQGLTTCQHGTIYAGDNQILDNHVHDVMNILHDGGAIYTLGGQGNGDGSTTSVLAGNLVEVGNHTNNRLYQDEGSSYWNTYNNVTRIGGNNWIGMWTPTIHDINIHDNYSDTTATLNHGTNITFNQTTLVSGGAWPSAAQAIIDAAGPDAAHQPLTGWIDDDDTAISYTGSWTANGNRGYGDYEDAVHATGTNGDTASLTFTGTGISVIGEKNTDQGQVEIFIDGTSKGLIDTSATTRQTQAVIYSTGALTAGSHTIQFVKRSGTWATLDGFEVTGVHNDTNSSITYTGASWRSYGNRGFGDYKDDVHAATTNGDSVTVTFTGTGISLVTETNSDEGTIAVSLDGASQGTVNASSTSRQAQQTVYTVSGLPLGRHTLTLTKTGGSWLVVDRFDVR
ncbi:right-handed parallel beta-helix repeat-containing protein [Streptomyces griseus]|uniref:right-handed parallel beta-helix repeat-containing protein n=1 Tax=Streptomyces griseus TaxID=1911 RepID=UPI00068F7727|nr:right-handed parallel beta-helix repeat-containing protein [Streptomyces griseus]